MATLMRAVRPNTNVSEPERWVSMIGGSSLVAYGLARRGWGGMALAAIGSGLLYRGATGHCDVYQAIGMNTAHRQGRNSAVPYELGVRVDKSVVIDKSPSEVFRFWRRLDNLPKFMDHLKEVRVLDDRRSEWVAKGPANMNVSWTAEIINEVEDHLIGWKSVEGSMVDNGGSVRFEPVNNGQSTEVKVSLQYNPPAGSLGAAVARMFGEEPSRQIEDDLHRLKELLETGSVKTQSAGKNRAPWSGTNKGAQKMWDRDTVDDSSEESFPASDPPSWTPERL